MKKLTLTPAALAGALLIAVLGTASAARAQTPPAAGAAAADQSVIVTNGEGMVTVAPDRAFVSITAESRAKVPKIAQQQNAEAMTAVQAKLKSLGIAGDSVRTIALDLQPEFNYGNGKQTLRGYVARNTIEVRVDAIEKVGDVVDSAVGSGATSVSNIRFDLKDRNASEQQALAQAVADARGRAEALAKAAGVTISRIVRIEDQSDSSQGPPMPRMAAFRQVADAAATTPVAAGQLEIRARVVLTARIN